MRFSLPLLQEVRNLLADRFGLALTGHDDQALGQALSAAADVAGVSHPETLPAMLRLVPEEHPALAALVDRLTVKESFLFRAPDDFAALGEQVLPALIDARRAAGHRRLRIWSAGCATGEEPYSLAILLHGLLTDRQDWHITLLATDISPAALAAADRGTYGAWSLRETPLHIRVQHFVAAGGEQLAVKPALRQMVTLSSLNLAGDRYPLIATNTTDMDLVLCRNVLMYFTPEAARAAFGRLAAALAPGGWLITNPVEAPPQLPGALQPAQFPGAVFFRKGDAGVDRGGGGWVGQ